MSEEKLLTEKQWKALPENKGKRYKFYVKMWRKAQRQKTKEAAPQGDDTQQEEPEISVSTPENPEAVEHGEAAIEQNIEEVEKVNLNIPFLGEVVVGKRADLPLPAVEKKITVEELDAKRRASSGNARVQVKTLMDNVLEYELPPPIAVPMLERMKGILSAVTDAEIDGNNVYGYFSANVQVVASAIAEREKAKQAYADQIPQLRRMVQDAKTESDARLEKKVVEDG